MQFPGISIIVPVYNGEAFIAKCIKSLLDLDYPVEKKEILIIDNNSKDKTAEIVREFPVKYIMEKKQGACNARNTGIKNAGFPLVAFTDIDCVVDKLWLRHLVKYFEEEKTGGVGGHLEPIPPKTVIEEYVIFRDILSQEKAMQDEAISPPFLITANAMYRKNILEEIGGFDETFTVNGEDADLSWRVKWKGYNILFEPKAIVHHYHRSTLRGLLKQIRSYGAGTSYLFHKHRKKLGFKTYCIKEIYYELMLSFIKIPFALIFGKTKLKRVLPVLDFLGALSFLSGKLAASLKLGIRFI
jgi:cellulose synthase/poly-beta-1,6-N-acetylglucosamine synthase-like glycosyltransferase